MTNDQHDTGRDALTRQLAAVPASEVRKLLARFESEIRADQRLTDAQLLDTRAAELTTACAAPGIAPHAVVVAQTMLSAAGLIRAGGAR